MSRFPRNRQGGTGSGIPSGSSAATAYWEAAVEYPTLVDGAVSDLPDIISTNNATQSTAANRPVLSRADNLENRVLYSEQFDNAAWVKTACTVTANSVNNPLDGNLTADSLLEDGTLAIHGLEQSSIPFISGNTYVYTVYAKANTRDFIALGLNDVPFGGVFQIGIFDLVNNLTYTSSGTPTLSITDVGGGWKRCSISKAATSTSTRSVYIQVALNSTTRSYTGTAGLGVYIYGSQLNVSTASSTYLATTTFPQYSGINGNAVPVFDGSNDSLATTIAVNPTGGMWGAVFVRSNILNAIQRCIAAWSSTASARFILGLNTSAGIACYVANGSTAFIGRLSASNAYAANESFVLSFTYDGGTSASGIKIYKNGVQVDTTDGNAGVYTVPTAGEALRVGNDSIGQAGGTTYFNGYLSPAVFGQGSTWADADRQATEQDLARKYIPNYVWFNPANNVTSDAGAVASWTDVTNTYVASQSTAANRPAVSTLNGQVAFLFDGSNDYLEANSIASLITGTDKPYTIIMVVQHATVATEQTYLSMSNTSGITTYINHYYNQTSDWQTSTKRDDASTFTSQEGTLTYTTETKVLSYNFSGTVLTQYLNGVQSSSASFDVGALTLTRLCFGCLNRGGTIASYFNGKIADIVIAPRAMSDSERQGWESRFMTQYGVV